MIEIKTQFPFIDENGKTYEDLIKTWAEDETGNKFDILQNETGAIYGEAIDLYPCRYTYSVAPIKEDESEQDENLNENEQEIQPEIENEIESENNN